MQNGHLAMQNGLNNLLVYLNSDFCARCCIMSCEKSGWFKYVHMVI